MSFYSVTLKLGLCEEPAGDVRTNAAQPRRCLRRHHLFLPLCHLHAAKEAVRFRHESVVDRKRQHSCLLTLPSDHFEDLTRGHGYQETDDSGGRVTLTKTGLRKLQHENSM